MLAGNRGWRIIQRGGVWRAIELRKSDPMLLMVEWRIESFVATVCVAAKEKILVETDVSNQTGSFHPT